MDWPPKPPKYKIIFLRKPMASTTMWQRWRYRDAGRIQDLRHTPHDYNTYTATNSNITNNPFQASSSMQTIENLLSLPIYMALSLLIGIATTIYLTRPKVVLQDLCLFIIVNWKVY